MKRVERFRTELRVSDGIILGSPEIHGSISGVLKNALDLAGTVEFEGKMVGLVGVAGGRMGATESLSHLRNIGRSLHAWVVPNQASIGDSSAAFDFPGCLSTPRSVTVSSQSEDRWPTSPDCTSARIACSSSRSGRSHP